MAKLEQRIEKLEARKPDVVEGDNFVRFINPVDMAVVKAFRIVGGKLLELPANEEGACLTCL